MEWHLVNCFSIFKELFGGDVLHLVIRADFGCVFLILIFIQEPLEFDWVSLSGGKFFRIGESNVLESMDLAERVIVVISVLARSLDLEDLG